MSDVSVEICLMQPLGSTSGKKLQIGSFKSKPGPVFFGFLRTGSHYVAQAGLELGSSCFSLPGAGVTSACHHAWLSRGLHFYLLTLQA
jgi:hypothetical protein